MIVRFGLGVSDGFGSRAFLSGGLCLLQRHFSFFTVGLSCRKVLPREREISDQNFYSFFLLLS